MYRTLAAVAVSVIVLAACTGDPEAARPDPEPLPTQTDATAAPTATETTEKNASGRTIPIQVWFLSASKGEPVLRLHHVEVPVTRAVGRAALEHLLGGVPDDLKEQDRDAWSAVPEGTELLGLTIENGTATVDFNEEFGNTELGTTYDGIQIDQVTWTLTQFPSVKRVTYLIQGEVPEEGIGGHGILVDKPMTRKNSEHWLPPIVVEAPFPDQRVGRTFELSGIANVYEATVSWRLTGLDREPFKRGFVTATCGTGCWGKFKDRISLERVPGEAIILEVFQSSAEDGSQLDLLKIPLNVQTAGP